MLTKLHGLCLSSKYSGLVFFFIYKFSRVVVRGRVFVLEYWDVNKNPPMYIFLMLEAKRDRWPSKINSS